MSPSGCLNPVIWGVLWASRHRPLFLGAATVTEGCVGRSPREDDGASVVVLKCDRPGPWMPCQDIEREGAACAVTPSGGGDPETVSYTHLRAHETGRNLVCRLL